MEENCDSTDASLFSPPKIVMTVVRMQLDKQINLHNLARNTINAHYDKARFAACIVRSELGCGLYFAAGTIVLTFRHLDLREEIEERYMAIVRAIEPTVQKKFSRIENSSVACGVKAKLFLNSVRRASARESLSACPSHDDVRFCPELFPGMSKRITIGNNSNVTLVLFCSGKYNIVGCKSREEIEAAYAYSVKLLREFIRVPLPTGAKRRRLD